MSFVRVAPAWLPAVLDAWHVGVRNRTRTVSLGICAIRASTWPDLRGGLSVSDCERPLFTQVNGPLMARRPPSEQGRSSVQVDQNQVLKRNHH
jgi:hypothetical protein